MSKPKITDTIGGYIYEWESEQVTIEVTRIKQERDSIKGQLTISTTAPGVGPHLHQAQFNFEALRSRKELAKILTEAYDIDWTGILEQLCVYTLEKLRRGEPVIEIIPDDDVQAPSYLLSPLILKNQPNCIFGDPGSAKSTVALTLSQLITLPWHDNPIGFNVPSKPTTCLYLDWETDEDTIKWQLNMLRKGMDIFCCINYRHCALPLAQDLEQIRQHIADVGAQVIIIDSLGYACGGELKESAPALAFFGALRQLRGVTPIILAHTSKDKENKHKTIFGSMYFEAGMRNVWEIRKVQEPGETEMSIAMFNRKSPPFQGMQKPLGFKFNFEGGKMRLEPEDPKNVREFLEQHGTQDRITDCLKQGKMSPEEIQKQLPDLTINNIRQRLSVMKKQNLIVQVTRGYYGLATKESVNDEY